MGRITESSLWATILDISLQVWSYDKVKRLGSRKEPISHELETSKWDGKIGSAYGLPMTEELTSLQ